MPIFQRSMKRLEKNTKTRKYNYKLNLDKQTYKELCRNRNRTKVITKQSRHKRLTIFKCMNTVQLQEINTRQKLTETM